MELVLEEPADDDASYTIGDVSIRVPEREQQFVQHYGILIEHFKFPHYQGFSVKLRAGGGC